VGFNSLSYFCHRFQEAYGATPAAYRTATSRPEPTGRLP